MFLDVPRCVREVEGDRVSSSSLDKPLISLSLVLSLVPDERARFTGAGGFIGGSQSCSRPLSRVMKRIYKASGQRGPAT